MHDAQSPNEDLYFGILAPIGTDLVAVKKALTRQLEESFGYQTVEIKLSKAIVDQYKDHFDSIAKSNCRFCEKREKIIHGTKLRKEAGDNAILAKWAVAEIAKKRPPRPTPSDSKNEIPRKRVAYIIDQLKRREEIEILCDVYGKSFFLLGVQSSTETRVDLLSKQIGRPDSFAQELIEVDQSEADFFKCISRCTNCQRSTMDHSPYDQSGEDCGQQLSKIFSEADIYVPDTNADSSIQRFLDLTFGSPKEFPSAAEHAMFMSFSASTRSADLSRQVGAVILSKSGDLVSAGSNDVPRYGGGIYDYDNHQNDVALGYEANSKRISEISENVVDFLYKQGHIEQSKRAELIKALIKNTDIGSITEFHRTVHAEMQAILSATRNGISTVDGTLFVTTFPCHNCAKHIVASGIKTVVYVEPYPKSLARRLHKDAIVLVEDGSTVSDRVSVRPFLGVGPRRFLDLFSIKLSSGDPIEKKTGYYAKEYKRSKSAMRFATIYDHSTIERQLTKTTQIEIVALIQNLQKTIEKMKSETKTPEGYTPILARVERLDLLKNWFSAA